MASSIYRRNVRPDDATALLAGGCAVIIVALLLSAGVGIGLAFAAQYLVVLFGGPHIPLWVLFLAFFGLNYFFFPRRK